MLDLIRQFVRGTLLESGLPPNTPVLLGRDDPRREQLQKHVFGMLAQTYEPIGGHFKVSSEDDIQKFDFWVVEDVDNDDQADLLITGNQKTAGVKVSASGTDGTAAAKQRVKSLSADLRKGKSIDGIGNWYGEVSGKPAYALLSRGAPAVDDEAKVQKILGKEITWHGEYPKDHAPPIFKNAVGWYSRNIGGHEALKIMIGNPK